MKLIYFYAFIVACNGKRFFTTEQCRSELERARHVVRLAATRIVEEEHNRQRILLTEIHATKPPINYESRRFALIGDDPLCPQPNTTMFPPQSTLSPPTMEKRTSKSTGRAASRKISVPSLFHIEANSDPYITWMKKLHGHLNRDEAICNGPEFRGLNTVTEDQLWGVVSLLLTNHAASLCPICHQMLSRIETIIYTPNRLLLNEEEQHLYRILFAAFPRTQALCSTLLPSCYANYAVQVANISKGTECMKCSICTSSLTALQHRFLLDAEAVKNGLAWLNTSFIHNICAELCLTFPPNTPSPGGFFPNGVNYTECVAFSNEAFLFAVKAARNILKPEYFCSLEMGWCQMNEVPNIFHCLRELCEEKLPVQLAMVCRLLPDEPIPTFKFADPPPYGPKLFPTEQSSADTHYKSEL